MAEASLRTVLLLSSRLHPPRRGRGVLPRPRLENLAPQLLEHSLTVLKAPPGFGKTTLACAWVEALNAKEVRSAWLTLEDSENSPTHLLYCLMAAMAESYPELTLIRDRIDQEMPYATPELLATQLINAIDQHPQPVLLVLDDCHRVSEQTLSSALHWLLRHAPKTLHILLISRQGIPGKLLQQVRGEPVLELDAQDLRFQSQETQALVSRAGLQCNAQQLDELQDASGGWSTALRAYLLSAQKNPHLLLSKGLNHLFDEMLEQCTPDFAEQLLKLGLLESFSVELIEHCLGHGSALLEQLEQGQFFLNLPGGNSPWYSFHHLFRDYLAQRHIHSQGIKEGALFKLSVADWLAAQGHLSPAINLALAAGAGDRAESWISSCAMDLVEQGDFLTLLHWERQLSQHLTVLPPSLRLALAWGAALAMQQEKASQLMLSLQDSPIAEQWEWHALNAMLQAMAGEGSSAAQRAGKFLAQLKNRPWIYNVLLNVQRYGFMQSADWAAYYSLPPLLSQPLSRSRYVFNRLYQQCIDALAELHQGRLLNAETRLTQALAEVELSHAQNPILAALPKAFLAQVRILQNQPDLAHELIERCIPYVQLAGFSEWIIAVLGSQIQLHLLHKHWPAARNCLDDLENLALARNCPRLLAAALVARHQLAQQEQHPSEQHNCIQRLLTLSQEYPQASIELYSYWLIVSFDSNNKQPDELDQLNSQSIQQLEKLQKEQRLLLFSQLQLARAKALSRQDSDQSSALLNQAETYIHKLGISLWLAETQSSKPAKFLEPATFTKSLHQLTVKERLILQELANGHSNKSIAKALGVTPETIKTHLKNIFSKLEVSNRAQAALLFQKNN